MAITVTLKKQKRPAGYTDWVVKWPGNPGKVIGRVRVGRSTKTDGKKYFAKAAAEKIRQQYAADLNTGEIDPGAFRRGQITLNEFSEWYRKVLGEDRHHSTRRKDGLCFDHLIAAVGGDTQVKNLDSTHVSKFKRYLTDERGLAAATVISTLSMTRALWNHGLKAGIIKGGTNPFAGQCGQMITKDERALEDDELAALLDAAAEWCPLLHLLLLLIANTGLRLGEAESLRWRDVSFQKGHIAVAKRSRGRVTIDGETFHTPAWSAKSKAAYREIPLPVHVMEALKLWKADHCRTGYVFIDEQKLRVLSDRIESGEFNVNERILHTIQRKFRKLRIRARSLLAERRGVDLHLIEMPEDVTIHTFRKTRLTQLSHFLPPQELKYIAGHANIETTMNFYAKVGTDLAERIRAAAVGSSPQGTTREQDRMKIG